MFLLCGLAAVILAASCKPSRRVPAAPPTSRQELCLSLRRAALDSGGGEIWIKGTPSGEFPPRRADDPVEVLAVPRAFGSVAASLEREASFCRARFATRETETRGREKVLEIRLSQGKELLGLWRLREVPRLRRAAIIIDDLGANDEAVKKLLALPYPLTFSVLPDLPDSRDTAEKAHQAGRDVMLHLPMEPIERPGFLATPGEVREGMSREQVERLVERDLAAVPYARGVNNHMGSRATQDPRLMAAVMQVLSGRHLYFIDSRTTGESVALAAARRAGLPAFYRSVFLDDTASVDYTLGQLRTFVHAIDQQGMALAIGHPHGTTIRALREYLPTFSEDDIELLPASRLVELPETARLSPPHANQPAPGTPGELAGSSSLGKMQAGARDAKWRPRLKGKSE